jgi:phage terminase small subunit
MAGPLPNARHELFAQERAKGLTTDAAYKKAGFRANRSNASRLNSNDRIKARIKELQGRAALKAEITAADIARQLDEDRDFARSCEAPSAAVSATMGKAKVLGLVVDKSKVDWTGDINVTVSQDDAAL